jgi:uncharacterized protein YbbK (DUF523 family)
MICASEHSYGISDPTMTDKPTIGISACLTGAPVRYDGGHKLNRALLDMLQPRAELVPMCPEAEAGLGVPREPVNLHGSPGRPRVMAGEAGRELTQTLRRWAMEALGGPCEALDGFVFRRKSPSCAVGSVPVYGEDGEVVTPGGVGLFARMFAERYPFRPIAEGQELVTTGDVERYLERVRLGREWLEVAAEHESVAGFHKNSRALLAGLAPDEERAMKGLLANDGLAPEQLVRRYGRLLASVLRHPALD